PHQISSRKTPFRKKLSSLYRFSKSKTYFEQCFDVIKCLGNGSFGQVLHVRCKETGKEYAVKRALRTGRFYIQTELCGPDLQCYRAHYGPLTENEQWTVFTDTLKALERLHAEDILHLDVKPSNIYIALDNRSCKLGDFGLAINLKKVWHQKYGTIN
ncbi:hypothetical protein GCK32_016135, partial [Trichostrongylus colubriformis]